MYSEKILYGLDKIHYCTNDGIIKPIKGALDIEVKMNEEYKFATMYGNDAIKLNGKITGTGTLNILSLTFDEQKDILGYKGEIGEIYLDDDFNPQPITLLFAREKADGSELYTVLYKCIFNITNIDAKTLQDNVDEDTLELNFNVLIDSNRKNLRYFTLDTKYADKYKVDNFFKEVQLPKSI